MLYASSFLNLLIAALSPGVFEEESALVGRTIVLVRLFVAMWCENAGGAVRYGSIVRWCDVMWAKNSFSSLAWDFDPNLGGSTLHVDLQYLPIC